MTLHLHERWLDDPAVAALAADRDRLALENEQLKRAILAGVVPHTPTCLTTRNAQYPCSCTAALVNARIAAALLPGDTRPVRREE